MADHVWRKKKLSVAVSSALAGYGADVAGAQEIEEIIVTATKRAESAQNIPVSVQAVGGDDLRDLRIETFDQYVEFLPNVVSAGNGPGKKELYIRGTATEQAGVTTSAPQGSAPGVALYVDEQPVSFGGRNLDVYAVDLERVEVLSGPQGTLFGASSQSGNVRLITNKPQLGQFDTGFNAKYGSTSGGADSGAVDAFVNVPMGERSAARVTVYSDTQGGWIDNVPAVFTPSGEVVDRNNSAGYGPKLTGADSVASARNDALVQDNWNEANYRGARFGFVHAFNEDWDLLVQHTAQTLEAEGSFIVEPNLGEDASAKFSPEYNRDEFGLTTWTLNGRLSQLDLIYTGGLLDREVDSLIDYTHYNNGGGYITYYLCSGNIYDLSDPNHCFDPTKQYLEDTANRRLTHEFRIATDQARPWRFLGGVYLNDVETNHVGDFQYYSSNPAFGGHINNYYNNNSGDGFLLGNTTIPTAGVNASGPRPPLTTFFNDFTREESETAFFGELAFDITDSVTASFSARSYDLKSSLQGASNFSFGCRYGIGGHAERTADGRCNGVTFSNDVTARLLTLGQYNTGGDESVILDARSPSGLRDMFRGGGSNQATLDAIRNGHLDISKLNSDGSITETDTIVKATLDWQVNNDVLLFATYAEGYRPATLNRNAGQLSVEQDGVYENYVVPAVALTDSLTDFELGVKSYLLDRSLRINATWFMSSIDDLQVARFDPTNVAFLYFIENVGDAESSGLDVDFQWLPTGQLSIAGAFSTLDTELTRINPQLQGISVPVGSELPLAPALAGNLRARYDFTLDGLAADAYITASVNYRGETVSGIVGSAEFMDDTLFRQAGSYSGLEMQNEGGSFGEVAIPDGSGGTRLPHNSRFVNPAATTLSMAIGIGRDSWAAELFFDNLNNESAPIMQIAGHYTPAISVQRPRTIGLRVSYDIE
ncbi:MAG: TonB-dependent receptor [Rhodospirillaceae bacterium]|nr:TonB-dependent receptor [Rhodospirillaceae bacterium]